MNRDGHAFDDMMGDFGSELVPGGGSLVKRAFSAARREWARNTSRALRAAEVVSGLSREDLQDLLEANPALTPLYLRVLWASGMNGHDETLRAMGATLGSAARSVVDDENDHVSVDDADQALMAMSNLTPRHFVVLRFIATRERPTSGGNPSGWSAERIANEITIDADRVAWCLDGLASAGLLVSAGDFFGGTFFWATDLGEAVTFASDAVGDRE